MSRQQQNVSYKNTEKSRAYVDGNTVRKSDTSQGVQAQEERRREQQQRRNSQTNTKQKQAAKMSRGYVMFLTATVLLLAVAGIIYIQLQTDNNKMRSSIASLEKNILELKTNNDARVREIESAVNLEEVKDIAINEMGMMYPTEEQVEYITVKFDDYMNQYQDIPKK